MFGKRGYGKLLLAGVVVLVIAGAGAPEAEAGGYWGGYHSGGYHSGGYGLCATVTCDPCCNPCVQPWGYQRGPIRRLVHGIFTWRPFYRWSGPGYYGSAYGYGDSYGVVSSSCCEGEGDQVMGSLDVPTDATPIEAPLEIESDAPLPGPGPEQGTRATSATSILPVSNTVTAATSGLLTIWVPADAKVTINGHETTSTGSQREYMSDNLKPGFTYNYEIHAEIIRDKQVVTEVQAVRLTAGDRKGVAFGFNGVDVETVAWVW